MRIGRGGRRDPHRLEPGRFAEARLEVEQRLVLAADGDLDPDRIDENTIGEALVTAGIPDPELLIRTSGKVRLSNFLLWQAAYAELVFIDACWPDFGRELLLQAIKEYRSRERRYGGLPNQPDGLKARRS